MRKLIPSMNGGNDVRYLNIAVCAFTLVRLIYGISFTPAGSSVREITFGFGPYINELMNSGNYGYCDASHCNYTSRMPGLPVFVYIFSFIGDGQIALSIFKNVFFSAMVYIISYLIYKSAGTLNKVALRAAILSIILMTISPPAMKHIANINYEEGYIVDLILLWTISILVATAGVIDKGADVKVGVVASIAIGLATVVFIFKSSMILLLVTSVFIGILYAFKAISNRRIPVYMLSVLVISGTILVTWGMHQKHHTGTFSIMTSFDGENLFRGANGVSIRVYPDTSLDRLFDSSEITLTDGSVIKFEKNPSRDGFSTEREWSDHYSSLAKRWIIDNPKLYINFLAEKAYNFLIEIRKTPFKYTSDNPLTDTATRTMDLVTSAWLAIGRLIQILFIYSIIRASLMWKTGTALAFMSAIAAGSYAAPYIIGFNYERHVTPFLLMLFVSSCFLLQWRKAALASLGGRSAYRAGEGRRLGAERAER